MSLLPTRDWSDLKGLLFTARRLVQGLYAGRHASVRVGKGLEFHDHRPYSPGDDPAGIDWKLFGRTDRYFLRRHEQPTDLHLYLMVDASASMGYSGLDQQGRPLTGEQHPSKWQYAATLAAAMAYLTIRQSDRAGLGVFTQRLVHHLPSGGTRSHLQKLAQTLEQAAVLDQPGDLRQSLIQAHALMPRRGLLVLISDLLDEPAPMLDGLGRFLHDRFDVIVFQVLHRQEVDLSGMDQLRIRLQDAETQHRLTTDLGRERERYVQKMAGHLRQLRQACAARGVDYNLLTTDRPVAEALRRYVIHRRWGSR